MKNTYINDNALQNYPFAYGQEMPFPNDIVAGLTVCIHNKTLSPVSAVTVTGAEIGDGRITLALGVTTDSLRYVGQLSAASGGTATLVVSNDYFDVHAVLLAGELNGARPLSTACSLALDPSCVSILPAACMGSVDKMVVNGYMHAVGECLSVQFAGSLSVTGMSTEQGGTAVTVDVEGMATAGSGTTAQSTLSVYSMVTSINGVSIDPATDYNTTLRVLVEPRDGEARDTDTMRRIRFGVVNGLPPSSIRFSGDPYYGDHRVTVDFNDVSGSGTVLTVIGGSEVPNCFNESDDSEHPDAGQPEDRT